MGRSAFLVAIAAALALAVTGCTDDSAMPGLGDPVASPKTPTTTAARPSGWEMVVLATSAVVTEPDPRLGGAQVLELHGTDPSVTAFTDRPTRVAGHMGLHEFLALWHAGAFGSDPPNAAVLVDGTVTVVELSRAVYDPATRRIALAARRLDTADGAPGPRLPVGQLGPIAVFVDAVGVPAGEVTDTVTTPDVSILGDAPAASMGDLYGTISRSLSQAFVNAQQQPSLYAQGAQATTDQSVPLIYSVDTAAPPGAVDPGATIPSSSMASILGVIKALEQTGGN